MNDLHLRLSAFNDLTPAELHELMRLRVDVFVVEQQCPYAEIDGLDPDALHMRGCNASNTLVAYARILAPGKDGLPHIGRVVVHPLHRSKGLFKQLMHACMDVIQERHGSRRNAISAQAHLRKLYEGIGYRVNGPVFDLDGIPHVDMVLTE